MQWDMNAFVRPVPGAGGDPRPRSRWLRSPVPPTVLALLLAAACATPRGPEHPVPGPGEFLAHATPRWVGQPLSWGKLEEIERWLLESASLADPYWRLEGELELAEGRLFFARADQGLGAAGLQRVELRVAAAREGFERVLRDPRASESQRRRAQRRLDEGRELDEAPPTHTPEHVLTRSAWGARPALAARLEPVGGSWRRITVHHSDEVPGVFLDGSLDQSRTALQKIQRYHQDQNGWGDIGYHYLIDPEGRVFEGRPLAWQGAHAGGTNNVQNLGICVLGNFHDALPTPRALASLERMLEETRQAHGIPRREVHVHRDYKDTLCPGDRLTAWVASYNGTPRAQPRAAAPAPAPRGAARHASGPRAVSGVH